MRPRKRRRTTAAAAASDDEAAPADDAAKGGSWKPVAMALDVMQAFEREGGVVMEECDDIGVTYGDDGLTELEAGEEREEELARAPEAGAERRDAAKAGKRGRVKARSAEAPKKRASAGAVPAAAAREDAPARSLDFVHGGRGVEEEVSADVMAARLPAWAPFGLHPLLMAGLAQLGFQAPTQVQARCLTPAILQRKDMVGAAETGSGKTLAFGLPILHHVLSALGPPAGEEAPAGAGRLLPAEARQLRALIVLPTRELAVQVQSHLNAVAQRTPLRAQCVVGGMSAQKQRRLLGRRPPVVVGTPGRISALLGLSKEGQDERCDWFREGLSGLRHLVLDEADRLVESGHFKELHSILGLLYESLERSQQLQTYVFSATLTLDPRAVQRRKGGGGGGSGEAKVDTLMRRMQFRDPRAVHLVDLTRPERGAEEGMAPSAAADGGRATAAEAKLGARLPAQLLFRDMACSIDKDREAFLVMWLLRRYRWDHLRAASGVDQVQGKPVPAAAAGAAATGGGRVLLFVNAISSVLRLSSVLAMVLESPSSRKVLSKVQMAQRKDDRGKPSMVVEVLDLHSRMRQKDRLQRIEKFRELDHAVLVCTDIAARGLDLPGIAAVVHYHVPRSAEVFVHRSGRTARAGRAGESVSITTPGDAGQWMRVYRAAGIEQVRLDDASGTAFELAAAREATRLAADLEGKIHRTKKERTDRSWLRRAAGAAELVLSEDEDDRDKGRSAAPRHALWGLYQQMLARVRKPPKQPSRAPRPGSRPHRRRRR